MEANRLELHDSVDPARKPAEGSRDYGSVLSKIHATPWDLLPYSQRVQGMSIFTEAVVRECSGGHR